jgi:tripartite-type tricarboxylate transporter receptor subunit TctC
MVKAWRILVAALALATAHMAYAAWPDGKPITIVVPFTPGGVTDGLARISGQWLSIQLKTSVIVENRPGAFGAIAAEYVKRAKPDGYTLFMGSLSQMGMLPSLQHVRYDPIKDFAPVSIIGTSPMVLAANLKFPPNNLQELVAYAKTHQVSFASSGNGSASHLAMIMFLSRAHLTMQHVPYKGGAPAMTDTLGGQVPLYFGTTTDVLPFATTGKAKALAVSSTKRLSELPKVPTVQEQGFPGFEAVTWNGLLAPAGTPPEAINTIGKAMEAARNDPAFAAKVKNIGADVLCDSPADFKARLAADVKLWGGVIKQAGVTIQ